MIKIAIIEDEEEAIQRLQDYVARFCKDYNEQISIGYVGMGVDFISDYRPIYDMILMDIEMPYLDGLSAAKKLRKIDENVCILFVTNMAQYAIKGYEVNALDFMVKPIDYFNFSIKLKKAIAYVRSHSDARIVLNPKNSMRTVSVKDIRYVEVLGHQLIYHNVDGDITVRGQLTKAEEELNKYNFARCNDCFLVNLRYVTGLETGSVLLGSDVLTISRRRKKEFLESVTNYLGGGN